MRKSLYTLAILALSLAGMVLVTGCGKKAVAPPPAVAPAEPAPEPAPTPPAPTIQFSASPTVVEQGQSSTLSWSTTNATGVTISGGIGTVERSGNRPVSPSSSMTYRARATGPGGVADAEVRITVTPAAEAIAPEPKPLSDAEWFPTKVKDIFFDYDSYDLRDGDRQLLDANAQALAERRGLHFTIEGHCDERGSEKYNLALGDKRANAARDYLISQGVDPSRIDVISYGEERPFDPGHDEAAWAKNRRAHFVLR